MTISRVGTLEPQVSASSMLHRDTSVIVLQILVQKLSRRFRLIATFFPQILRTTSLRISVVLSDLEVLFANDTFRAHFVVT